ncbi:hypothetical protein HSR121_0913 [Halapricum desulfuricans]|uniref:Uncharacterized protein n=2 Tax=Halapricum desulfuricans TaxID=2841257 RepID=A0A897MXC3_9EURY|nr:hypothetical protein HSR121_0913 [Halapricum desulfuricans]
MGYTDAERSTATGVAAFVLVSASGASGTTFLGAFLAGYGVGGDLRFRGCDQCGRRRGGRGRRARRDATVMAERPHWR